ncbi:NAD-dependent epimerase/dehydratase family protein [Salibacterium aidingense]|uniref:NAD-dependent epimerase/dehydratase family protein n=1 Tax=Salibacterium aidingense TaxID=384933 RepID=UPI00041F1F15|nr:NAD(P)-dependent oxidoreductase [Salibacterium aidingense]
MKTVIIGGDGFIGSHIARTFIHHGAAVTTFGPGVGENLLEDLGENVQQIKGDITDFPSLQRCLLKVKPDVLIHLAAFGAGKDGLAQGARHHPDKALQVNIHGFYNVIEAAQIAQINKVLWSSSTTVYGWKEEYAPVKVDEKMAVNPHTFYGSTKVMDELMTNYYRDMYQMEIAAFRLPLVYGPGRWYKGAGNSLVDLFESAHRKQSLTIKQHEQPMDLMYVKDVGELFYKAAITARPLENIYNVKSHTTTWEELAETVNQWTESSLIRAEKQSSQQNTYPLIDVSRVEKDLRYVPDYDVRKACRDYLKVLEDEHV